MVSIIEFKNEVRQIIIDLAWPGSFFYLDHKNQVFQIKICEDLPGFIPSKLFFHDRLFTILKEGSNKIEYYESF